MLNTAYCHEPSLDMKWGRVEVLKHRSHDDSLLEELIEKTQPPAGLRIGPGQSEAPLPSPVLGMCSLPTIPTVGAIFRDTVLRENVCRLSVRYM